MDFHSAHTVHSGCLSKETRLAKSHVHGNIFASRTVEALNTISILSFRPHLHRPFRLSLHDVITLSLQVQSGHLALATVTNYRNQTRLRKLAYHTPE